MLPEEQDEYLVNSQIVGAIGQNAQSTAAAQYYVQEQEKTIAEAQLECERILEKVRHMLKQDIKKYKDDGTFDWISIKEEDRMLTDLGINRIMQTMEAYVNKENLLSNYDDKIINRRMLEFCYALNGNLFMKYELYFKRPSIDEAIKLIEQKVKDKSRIKAYTLELLGEKKDIKTIEKENFEELQKRINIELAEVMKQKQRQNQAEYELLFTELKAIVESVHQRAWRGEERGSLRRHTNISEIIGNRPSQKEGGGMFKWMKG